MSVVRQRSRESGWSRVTQGRLSVASAGTAHPPPTPHLTQRMLGNIPSFQRGSIAGAFSAEPETSRHSVGVRQAVKVGGMHPLRSDGEALLMKYYRK